MTIKELIDRCAFMNEDMIVLIYHGDCIAYQGPWGNAPYKLRNEQVEYYDVTCDWCAFIIYN